jgi:hypothetical protein
MAIKGAKTGLARKKNAEIFYAATFHFTSYGCKPIVMQVDTEDGIEEAPVSHRHS